MNNQQISNNTNPRAAEECIPSRLHSYHSQKLVFKSNKSSPLITKNSLLVKNFHMVVHNKLNRKHKKFSSKILKSLKSNPFLSNLTFHYAYAHHQEVTFLSHILKHFRKMSSLQLRIMNDLTSLDKLNDIARSLIYLPFLKSLDITIPYSNPTKTGKFRLSHTLKGLKNLTSFSLNSSWGGALHVDKISFGLRTMTNLTSLNLNFSCSDMTDSDCFALADCLNQLTNLKTLTLDLSRNSISIDGFNSIVSSLKNLTELQELSLNFLNNVILAQSLATFKDSMQALTQLQVFNLNLSSMKIFADSIKELGHGIGFLKNLKVFKLAMLDCCLSGKSIVNIGKGISELKGLEDFEVDLTNNQLIDKQVLEFVDHFRELSELKQFSMSLSKNPVGDWVLTSLSKILAKQRNLEMITLNAFGCRFSDKGIENLTLLSNQLEKMKELVLNFHKNANIKDEGVKKLMDSLSHVKGLKNIRIDFAECKLSEEIEEFYIEKLRNELPQCNSTLLFGY